MANEYLQRTPTSTGNRRVFTWSGWVKFQKDKGDAYIWHTGTQAGEHHFVTYRNGNITFSGNVSSTAYMAVATVAKLRDFSSWIHLLITLDSTQTSSRNRYAIYVNGVYQPVTITTEPTQNAESNFNKSTSTHFIGVYGTSPQLTFSTEANITDIFFIDGQALTPDVFGKYIKGNGYISAGSTQATDFKKGQWVPKLPKVIKSVINARGGFGVNGFYLPMNDSKNFGADFHCDPNSIIKLNEELAQPRVGVATTASASAGFTDALRADPYAANLVLALPFVSGGLQSGFGDYSAAIKGSGSAKVGTLSNSPSIGNTAGYYGSALSINGTGSATSGSPVITFASNTDFNFSSSPYTIECWLNPSTSSMDAGVVVVGDSGAQTAITYTNGLIRFRGPSGSLEISSPTYSQVNQWFHTAIVRETGSNIKLYVNGVCVGVKTNFTSTLSQDKLNIGAWTETGTFGFRGQIQDLRIYKGVAKYTGGFDVSRPYTPVGIATFRAVPDCTANNFATLNPLQTAVNNNDPGSFADGNLTVTYDTSTNHGTTTSNIGIGTTGKWYVEARVNSLTASGGFSLNIGVTGIGRTNNSAAVSFNEIGVGYRADNGEKRVNATGVGGGTASAYGSSYTSGDIIGIGVSNGDLTFYKNGVSQGIAYTGITTFIDNNLTNDLFFGCGDLNAGAGGAISWNFGQNPTFSGNTTAGTFTDSNGKGLFKYQPPSGFLALCEDNLPTPVISDPGKYFRSVLYTGSGSASQSVVGVGFTPDLVWIKHRTSAGSGHIWTDSVRGAGRAIFSFATSAEDALASTGYLSSFDNDGFSLSDGSSNGNRVKVNAAPYVAWCWRAGAGTTSTNTNGSITSVVSVNQDAGFSIVSWTGNGSSTATVGHGLGKTPAFLISKARGGTNDWWVVHKSGNGNLQLNTTVALVTSGGSNGSMGFPSTLTSSTFTFTNGSSSVNNVNQNGISYIAYCWAEIEGFSKFGRYVGNGNANGPFVYCGFKPAWVMYKRTDSGNDWVIFDSSRTSTNPANAYLEPNTSDIETTDSGAGSRQLDILSNGFKLRDTAGAINASGGSYIFAAYAESPFKTANAK